jgi:hypothetical protein
VRAHRHRLGQGKRKGPDPSQDPTNHKGGPDGAVVVDADHLGGNRILGAGPNGPPDPRATQHFARAKGDQHRDHKQDNVPNLDRTHPVDADQIQQIGIRQ